MAGEAGQSCESHSALISVLASPTPSAVTRWLCLSSAANADIESNEWISFAVSFTTPSLSTTSSSIVSAKRAASASRAAPSTISPSMQNCVTVSHHEPCSIFLMPPLAVMIALTRSISVASIRFTTIEHRCSWKVKWPKR